MSDTTQYPIIIPRDLHQVSRKYISDNALKVLYRLNKSGYDAYLVGGGVRDMLLGIEPKDFDIATNATPEQIKALFRNCRLIGRRFRLAHIVFGRDIIEVATFRGHHDSSDDKQKQCKKISKQSADGMLLRDNIYGSIDEDAERRDFTINALYYNVADFNIYDFADGVKDIEARKIKLIGDPETRYREDPVRMLRAVRFATKLDMTISEETAAPIKPMSSLLGNIPPARMFEEFLKLFISGDAVANFDMLREYDLFKYLFPQLEQALLAEDNETLLAFVRLAMANTDERINQNLRVTPAFLLAAFLWYPLSRQVTQLRQNSQLTPQDAFFSVLHEVMSEQQRSIAIPKRFQAPMKDIWILQDKLQRRDGKRAYKTLEHPKFRAGYDLLLLRGEIEGGEVEQLAKWWTDFQDASPELGQMMIKSLPNARNPRRSVRKRRKPRKTSAKSE
ncbi:MAG: polynucleotide adenylyltransferase PcnB [Thalassotalea sp.]|nr:polynucleotide adenylyltransferase PcnB [Thalassotalea sp.]